MSSWKIFQNFLVAGVASLFVSTNSIAAVSNPQLDIQLATGDSGVTISGSQFGIDASLVAIILGGGATTSFTPPFEPFSLTSTAGVGGLQVGIGGSLLDATFNNLVVTDLGFGTGGYEADLTYIGGSLAGSLNGGRIEGTYSDGSFVTADVIAKIGPVVPVPAAVWLFGSGLLGLIAVARRKAS